MRTGRDGHDRGFTLVEILVVVTIIAALLALAIPAYQNAQDASKVTMCGANLRGIQSSLFLWKQRNKNRWPKESGPRFLLVLVRDGMIENKDMKVFLCPGTEDDNTLPDDPTPGAAYQDFDSIDSASISYAGRDAIAYPLDPNRPGNEIIASDDNEFFPNHRKATNYVYADGSVAAFDRDLDARDHGIDIEGDRVPIGEDSPVEMFRVLRID